MMMEVLQGCSDAIVWWYVHVVIFVEARRSVFHRCQLLFSSFRQEGAITHLPGLVDRRDTLNQQQWDVSRIWHNLLLNQLRDLEYMVQRVKAQKPEIVEKF